MSSKLFTVAGFNPAAAFTASAPKLAVAATTLTCVLQLAPVVGGEVTAYGCGADNTTANTPYSFELCEVDVAATMATASQIPCTTVSTAISSSGTTTLVTAAALGPSGTTAQYSIATWASGGNAGGGEQMLVTAGMASTSMTVVRGINDTTALSSIPIGTIVYPIANTGCPSAVAPVGSQPAADPTYATSFLSGTGLTGFGAGTYNAPKNLRIADPELIPPTAPYVVQQPPERGFEFNPYKFLQIRVYASAAVNVMPWITVQI